MKMNMKNLIVGCCLATIISFGIWLWEIYHTFVIPSPWWEVLPKLISQGLDHPQLKVFTFKSMAFGYGAMAFFLYLLWGDESSRKNRRVVSGARVVDTYEISSITRENKIRYWIAGLKQLCKMGTRKREQIEIASVPMPKKVEAVHTLFAGSTGTGKTTGQDEMISGALERGDRIIVVDNNAHSLERFARKGDVLLNPFDKRSPGWSPFNELIGNSDYKMIATALIPDANNSTDQSWHDYARTMLAECMRALTASSDMSTERLVWMATKASSEELSKLLAGSAVAGLFQPGAEKPLASARFILTHCLEPYQHLRQSNFSLRKWIKAGRGNLFITWKEDQIGDLKPLVTAWLEIMIKAILTGEESNNPTDLFIDELGSLECMSGLEAGLTKGRKYGLRIVACLQSISQLEAIYGTLRATTLRQCFRNIVVLGGSNSDPATAEELSKGLGQSQVEYTNVNYSRNSNGTTVSKSVQHASEYAVTSTEIMSLDPYEGFLKFSGNYPIARIKFVRREYATPITAFMER